MLFSQFLSKNDVSKLTASEIKKEFDRKYGRDIALGSVKAALKVAEETTGLQYKKRSTRANYHKTVASRRLAGIIEGLIASIETEVGLEIGTIGLKNGSRKELTNFRGGRKLE